MVDLDYNDLTLGVAKRLNEIFVDDLQSRNSQKAKLKFVKSPSLANLRNIIMSLEWEVTDGHLKDLMQELYRLQKAYIKDHVVQKLLKLLLYLGRYISVYQSDTHPYIFKMLFQTYSGLTKIVSGKYSNQQKARIVNDQIKRYLSLKSYMKRKNTIKSRRTVDNLSILDKDLLSPTNSSRKQIPFPLKDKGKIHYSTLNYNFNEMKKFIYLEIKKLRKDLQRIATLLHAKT